MRFYLEICDDRYQAPPWRVVAHASGPSEDQCEFVLWLETLDGAVRNDALTALAKLHRVCASERGPRLFDTDECHHVHTVKVRTVSGGYRSEKIWQVSGRQVRLLWFYGGDGKIVVVSHGFLKKSKGTPESEQNRAGRLCEEYFEAAYQRQLKIFREE